MGPAFKYETATREELVEIVHEQRGYNPSPLHGILKRGSPSPSTVAPEVKTPKSVKMNVSSTSNNRPTTPSKSTVVPKHKYSEEQEKILNEAIKSLTDDGNPLDIYGFTSIVTEAIMKSKFPGRDVMNVFNKFTNLANSK